MKFNPKILISFSLLYIVVVFMLIFPYYAMSDTGNRADGSQQTSKKELVIDNVSSNETKKTCEVTKEVKVNSENKPCS